MTKRLLSFLLCAFILLSGANAAQKKKTSSHKKLSKTYVDAPLADVLADIGKRTDYTIDYQDAELDLGQPVKAKFKDVSAVTAIRKILGKKYVVKAKRSVIKITNVPAPPIEYKVEAAQPASVEEDEEKTVRIYQDTVYSVRCRTQTQRIEPEMPAAPPFTRKGHYIQALVGAGYGSLGYKLRLGDEKAGKNLGDFQGSLQVQYAYYFHDNWGVTAGLALSDYASYGKLNYNFGWENVPGGDSEGEKYNHHVATSDWTERQNAFMVEVPVGLQCMYPLDGEDLLLYAGVGLSFGFPVLSHWQLRSGTIAHEGEYPQWGMYIKEGVGGMDNSRDFYSEQIGEGYFAKDKHNLNLKTFSLGVSADLGLVVPLAEQIDLLCGMYFRMYCMDLNGYSSRADIGWANPEAAEVTGDPIITNAQYRQHNFMQTYDGMVASNLTDKVLPWGAGLKVGVQWHHKPKPKKPEPIYEKLQICDTTFTLAERRETVMKPKQEVVQKIAKIMHRAVIWFDLNSTEPKLEPADVLDRLAEVLIAAPDQQVVISGHASKEGNARRNRVLSEKRAQAVADLLIKKGVAPAQLLVEAHSSDVQYSVSEGETYTIALDRRVEIIPLENGQKVMEVQIELPVETATK